MKQELVFQQRLDSETQELKRRIKTQQEEIEALVKAEHKLIKEKIVLKSNLDNTKKFIGSVVTIADPKERESKEMLMLKESTATLIAKETEISELKQELVEIGREESGIYKQLAYYKDEHSRCKEHYQLLAALVRQMADMTGIAKLSNEITEFIHRVETTTKPKEYFDKIVETLASSKV